MPKRDDKICDRMSLKRLDKTVQMRLADTLTREKEIICLNGK